MRSDSSRRWMTGDAGRGGRVVAWMALVVSSLVMSSASRAVPGMPHSVTTSRVWRRAQGVAPGSAARVRVLVSGQAGGWLGVWVAWSAVMSLVSFVRERWRVLAAGLSRPAFGVGRPASVPGRVPAGAPAVFPGISAAVCGACGRAGSGSATLAVAAGVRAAGAGPAWRTSARVGAGTGGEGPRGLPRGRGFGEGVVVACHCWCRSLSRSSQARHPVKASAMAVTAAVTTVTVLTRLVRSRSA